MKQWRNKKSHIIKPSMPSPQSPTSVTTVTSLDADTESYQDSDVKCIEELKTSTFCKMTNIQLDFSRMLTRRRYMVHMNMTST